jgi:DNA-directed RNA polymerase subunit M/transcription elongation factor TFIIS
MCPNCQHDLYPIDNRDAYECANCDYSIDFDIAHAPSFDKMFPSLLDDIDTVDYSMLD